MARSAIDMPRFVLKNFAYSGSFNGTNNYVDIGVLGSLGSNMGNGFSVAFWVKTNGSGAMVILGTRVSASNNYLKVHLNAENGSSVANSIQLQFVDTTNKALNGYFKVRGISGHLNNGEWHHVVITCLPGANTITGYVDGVAQTITYNAQQTPVAFSNFATNMWVGTLNANGTGTAWFKGLMNRMSIWNRVLSQTDVSNLYYNGDTDTTSLLANLFFNEGTGSSVVDNSGNGANGTWNGTLGSQWSTDVFMKTRSSVS